MAGPAKPQEIQKVEIDFNAADAAFAKLDQWLAFFGECRTAISAARAVQGDIMYLQSQLETARKDLAVIEAEKTTQYNSMISSKENAERGLAAIREATEAARVAENAKLDAEVNEFRLKATEAKAEILDEITLLTARKETAEKAAVVAESRLAKVQAELRGLRNSAEEILAKT